jgi:hypothetical protein
VHSLHRKIKILILGFPEKSGNHPGMFLGLLRRNPRGRAACFFMQWSEGAPVNSIQLV